MYYIEIPQQVTNENVIILVYYKTVIPCVILWDGYLMLTFIIEALHLITNI